MGEGRHIREFPENLPLLRDQVARVSFWHALFEGDTEAFIGERLWLGKDGFAPLYDRYDFCVEMKDGRDFVFTACTPEYVRAWMQREQEISFVDSGLVMVTEIGIEAMLNALEQCLDLSSSYGLGHFGILATPLEEDETGSD